MRAEQDCANTSSAPGGSTFTEAFERHVGVGLEEYEAQFFDLMNEYLS